MPPAIFLTKEEQETTLENLVRTAEQQGWLRNGDNIDEEQKGLKQEMHLKGRFGITTGVKTLRVGQTGHVEEASSYWSWWFFEQKGYQLFLATLATAATICAAVAAVASCLRSV